MFRVLNCLASEHDLRLVVLAGIVCFLASLAAVSLFDRARASDGRARLAWILTAGTATGCGIWATHFIAMLAYDPGVTIAYKIGLTAVSLAAAAAVTSIGLIVALYVPWRRAAALGGGIVGGGVACMHYTGMWAVELPGHVTWSPDLVALSIIAGIALGMAAIAVAVRGNDLRTTLSAALLLTLAIVSHHFTAMGAVEIVPDPARVVSAFSMSPLALATAIACAAIAVLGMSLIGAVTDRRLAAKSDEFAHDKRQLIAQSEEKLREQHLRLDTAINNMSQGLLMFNSSGRLLLWNERYIEIYGLSSQPVKPGCTVRELLEFRCAAGTFSGDFDQRLAHYMEKVACGVPTSYEIEVPDGRTISTTICPMPSGGWVATHSDITERRRAEKQIAYLAHHDALTGLSNRAVFTEHLAATRDRASGASETFAVLCLDLDRFKEINDVFGHAMGDGLLREVARRLQAAAPGVFLARLGGDEFTLIAAEGAQPAAAESLAESLQAAFDQDIEVDGHLLRTSVSIGIAVFPADGSDTTALLANADAALYRAKAEGRGTIRFFAAEMDEQLRERRVLQQQLRGAIDRNELVLYYQPQARLEGGIVGFEALVRWDHPGRGLVPPGMFIPLAEESGLIIPIGEWILREACREAASWREPLQIAVNLSPIQFRHGDLPGLVHAVLLETGLAASRLELEITEGVLIHDHARGMSILRRLKALGVRISMDDFGTGYSSLSYLQSFPFDKIKIDKAFISNLERNPQSAAIVRAVIGLGRGLALPVVAEGVETASQQAFLRSEGCDELQGYLIGRPLPIDAYARLVGQPERELIAKAG